MSNERVKIRIYVDAKILGMHDKSLPKNAYVGYCSEDKTIQGAKPIQADESDDAEIQAILFAIEELRELSSFTIICDHQSVVSEAARKNVKKPTEWLVKLRKTLAEKPNVELKALEVNLAHGILTEYVNRMKHTTG